MNYGSSSGCSFHFVRLTGGQDVRRTLQEICVQKNINAASIVSAVGSLSVVRIRKADSDQFYESHDPHELLTLSGLLSNDGIHLHVSVANKNADVFGGHLSEGNTVHTTLEVTLAEFPDTRFLRKLDPKTGYPELSICRL